MFEKEEISPDTAMYDRIDAINLSIKRIRSSLKDRVDTSSIEDLAMIRSQVDMFFQGHLRRALAFLDGGKHALDAGHGLVALTSVRCLYESAACIHDFCNHVIKLIDADNLPDAIRLAHRRSLSQRFEVKKRNTDQYDYTAVNILTQIDAMDRVMPGVRRDYDQLSEFVHPNAYGSLLYFIENSTKNAFEFRTPLDDRDTIMGLLLTGASLFGLMESDSLRFSSSILGFVERSLQARIDDYYARKGKQSDP